MSATLDTLLEATRKLEALPRRSHVIESQLKILKNERYLVADRGWPPAQWVIDMAEAILRGEEPR